MKYKRNFLAICLIICIFSIANASASDVNDTAMTSDNNLIENDTTSSTEILSANPDGTFTDLANEIASATDELNLTRNYVYSKDDSIYQEGISIDKSIAINGNGFAINGNNHARIFKISSSNVILNDIHFVNAYVDREYGGAIYWSGADGSAVNCTFINNTAYKGGAISGGSAANCTFINNTAGYDGGATYCSKYHVDCTFVGNSAYCGGAIYCGPAVNCTFTNNSAIQWGGAMYGETCINSTFTNNRADMEGGAVYMVKAANCLFEYNYAGYGGAMSFFSIADTCTFNYNTAVYGGAIYDSKVSTNSKFNNNDAVYGENTYNVTWYEKNDGKSFTDLKNIIEKNESDVYLNDDYAFDLISDYRLTEGIDIDHAVTIYGNGHTINGNNIMNIFKVNSDGNVVFKDIVFTNGDSVYGGAIYGDCSAVNCTFINNTAFDGGAISGNCSAVNCIFINNTASNGGAISGGSAVNCTFTNNSVDVYGGAIYYCSAANCNFINNRAETGGAMHEGTAVNCTFLNNNAEYHGGAIWYGSAVNCTFINNTANEDGGAICDCSAVNCTFISNSAIDGGAMCGDSAINCTFINNHAKYGGATFYCNVTDCIFKGNSADQAGKDCYPVLATVLTARYDSTSKNIVAVVKDADGNPVSGIKVGFACKGVKYALTDVNGQALFSTSDLAGGSNTVKVMAYGSYIYDDSNQVTVTVNKEYAKIFLRNALYFVLQTKMVKVTLWDANNKPLANKTVHITLNEYSLKYHGVTDENGNTVIRVGVGFGTHSATVSFDGDEQYGSISKTGSIRVIKETPSLMLPGAYTKFKATNPVKTVKIYLKDRYDKPLLPETKVFIKINGQIYSGLIDNEGIASINLKINTAGTYNAELIYTGNTAYNAVRKTTRIFIT